MHHFTQKPIRWTPLAFGRNITFAENVCDQMDKRDKRTGHRHRLRSAVKSVGVSYV